MIIRKARLKDIPEIIGHWKNFMSEHKKLLKHPGEKENSEFLSNSTNIYRNFLRKNIKGRNSVVFVVDDGSAISGFIIAQIRENIPLFKIKKLCFITDLYVTKHTRGRRNSSSLFDNVCKWAKSKGVTYVSLNVQPENILARKIYEKWGFFANRIEMRKKL